MMFFDVKILITRIKESFRKQNKKKQKNKTKAVHDLFKSSSIKHFIQQIALKQTALQY